MPPNRFIVVASTLLFCLTAASFGQEPSTKSADLPQSLIVPWTDAVDQYKKAQESAAAVLTRLLDVAEEKARANGDLEKVKAIQMERTSFQEAGTLPKSVKTATYDKAMETAKSTLRNVAQKTKKALLKQKLDDEAEAIENELADLIGMNPSPAKEPLSARPTSKAGSGDARVYWVQTSGNAELRMIKPGYWVETNHDGSHNRHFWNEVARFPEFVELHDKERSLGMRLFKDNGLAVQNYRLNEANKFVAWSTGAWVIEPPDVVYLSDIRETSHKVMENKKIPGFGWGKNGKILGKSEFELIYLANRPSPNGIYTHPPTDGFASVNYQIGKLKKQVFRARFGIADIRNSDSSPLKFVVMGDGTALFTSKPFTKWDTSEGCEVNIRDVKELELRVECTGDAGLSYAVWYEPRISSK